MNIGELPSLSRELIVVFEGGLRCIYNYSGEIGGKALEEMLQALIDYFCYPKSFFVNGARRAALSTNMIVPILGISK